MKIEEFLAAHFCKRLEQQPVLAVYDPEKRYGDVIRSLAGRHCQVIDASASTITGRETAMDAWIRLGEDQGGKHRLIVYLTHPKPLTDEARRKDPFQIFAIGGNQFPDGDGESWRGLCHRAAPGKTVQIDSLFTKAPPDFAVIDHLLGEGSSWPKLQSILNAQSALELVGALLTPDEGQQKVLEKDDSWIEEGRSLLGTTLQFEPKDGSGTFAGLRQELARFVLFSEFVFDLPEALPPALADVPHAGPAQRDLVFAICDSLRHNVQRQEAYMHLAEKVAADLHLEGFFAASSDLGRRDTFAFEERTFLNRFAEKALAGDHAAAAAICHDREKSIWVRHTARQQFWSIANRARELLSLADDLEPRLKKCPAGLSDLQNFYCREFRQLDSVHRELEQAVADVFGELSGLDTLVETCRKRYLQLAEKLQGLFLHAVTKEGWPVQGIPRNVDVFRKFVAPWLEQRRKVALFMVDSLRFELAIELEKQLGQHFKVTVTPVSAQLPTITPVGMAALLPDADTDLRLNLSDQAVIPELKGEKVSTPDDRLKWCRARLGDLCHMRDLEEILNKARFKIPDTTRLLLVKSGEIDQICENTPGEAWRILPKLVQKLLAGVRRVREKGFERVVLATDHGFFLTEAHQQGDVAPKPSGDWSAVKNRCLLGSGTPGPGAIVLASEAVGIQGNFASYAVPASLATFSRGVGYFHSGLSLQECILPVLEIDVGGAAPAGKPRSVDLALSYKGGKVTTVTTRRPMIEVRLQGKLYDDEPVEFQLSAWAAKKPVGEVATCNHLHPSTGLVSLQGGESIKVPFRLDDEFSGEFEIRAEDPVTGITYAKLKLKTDYTE